MTQARHDSADDPAHRQNGANDGAAPSPSGEATPEPVAATVEAVQAAGDRVAREQYPHERVKRRAWGWVAAYIVMLLAVIALAFAAHSTRILPGDLTVTRDLQDVNNPVVFDVLYAVSYIGYGIPFTVITIGVLLILALLRLWVEALFVLLTIPALLVEVGVKALVARPRPSALLVHVTQRLTDPSFPSGHVLHYTVFYGFLAFMLGVVFRPGWGRNILMALCFALIALVGVSRVYLGEHWTTDVIGGYLIGALYLGPLCAAYIWAHGRAANRKLPASHPAASLIPTAPITENAETRKGAVDGAPSTQPSSRA